MLMLAARAVETDGLGEELAVKDARSLIQAFRLDQERRALSPETIRVREVALHSFARHRGGDLLGATRRDVHAWLDGLRLVDRSKAKYLSHIRNFYAFLLREEMAEGNPAATVEGPRLPRLLPRPVGDDDLAHALAEAPPKIEAMLTLACFEGLRCAEIAACQVDWFHLGVDPPVMRVLGKGQKERIVPLGHETERALHRYSMPRAGHVFLTSYGRPYRPRRVSELLAKYLRGIGVDATAHRFRHWFGTELYRRCRDLVLVQEMMGHADPSTTRGYVALSPDPEAAQMVRHLSARGSAHVVHRGRMADR